MAKKEKPAAKSGGEPKNFIGKAWAWVKAKCTLKFWLTQVLDVAIAVIVALWILGVIPWQVVVVVVVSYIAIYSIHQFRQIWAEEKSKWLANANSSKNGGKHGKKR